MIRGEKISNSKIKTKLIKYLNTNKFSEQRFSEQIENELSNFKKEDIISMNMISSDCMMITYVEDNDFKINISKNLNFEKYFGKRLQKYKNLKVSC